MSRVVLRKITLARLERTRPGFEAAALTMATFNAGAYEIELGAYRDLLRRYPDVQRPAAKAGRLILALRRWLGAGFPVADRITRTVRKAICEACPMWRPSGNAGFGECLDPRCGCTRAKRWLATERCPQGKWPEPGVRLLFSSLASALKAPIRAVREDLGNGPDSKTRRNSS